MVNSNTSTIPNAPRHPDNDLPVIPTRADVGNFLSEQQDEECRSILRSIAMKVRDYAGTALIIPLSKWVSQKVQRTVIDHCKKSFWAVSFHNVPLDVTWIEIR